MVHIHTQNPNEPSLGAGAYVCLGLTLTPSALCANAVVCVLLCASWDVKMHFDARRGGRVKGGSTWEFDSVCTYLRTYVVCPWSVHVGK